MHKRLSSAYFLDQRAGQLLTEKSKDSVLPGEKLFPIGTHVRLEQHVSVVAMGTDVAGKEKVARLVKLVFVGLFAGRIGLQLDRSCRNAIVRDMQIYVVRRARWPTKGDCITSFEEQVAKATTRTVRVVRPGDGLVKRAHQSHMAAAAQKKE
jgi:hypothetical protein